MHLTGDTTAHLIKLGFLWGENTVQNMFTRNSLQATKNLLCYKKIPTV